MNIGIGYLRIMMNLMFNLKKKQGHVASMKITVTLTREIKEEKTQLRQMILAYLLILNYNIFP